MPSDASKPARKRRPAHWEAEGRRLATILEERKIRPSTFARSIDRAYYHVYRWRRGLEFTPENQAICCTALGLPPGTLADRNAVRIAREHAGSAPPLTSPTARQAELDAREALEAFSRTPLAATLSPAQWSVLRSMRFYDPTLRPSVALYNSVAYALHGAIRVDEIASIAAVNSTLDDSLARKPRLPRRRKG